MLCIFYFSVLRLLATFYCYVFIIKTTVICLICANVSYIDSVVYARIQWDWVPDLLHLKKSRPLKYHKTSQLTFNAGATSASKQNVISMAGG